MDIHIPSGEAFLVSNDQSLEFIEQQAPLLN